MKVVRATNFSLYIYSDDHPPPHCHVRFKDGSDVSIDIPLIIPRYGATISKEIEEVIEKNLEKLCNVWEQLNHKTSNKTKKT